MYSLVRGSGVGVCIGAAPFDVARPVPDAAPLVPAVARAASLRRVDGAETRAPRPPCAATMPVAAIEARINAMAATAFRRGRRLNCADDFLPFPADDFLPGLFLDIPLPSSPD